MGENIEIVNETNIEKEGMPDISSMLGSKQGGMPDISAMLNSLGSEAKNGDDLNNQLNQINEKLISQLPEDKQQDMKMMTENMAKIMKTISKN